MSKRKNKRKPAGLNSLIRAVRFRLRQAGLKVLLDLRRQIEVKKGLLKTPLFYFGAFSFILLSFLFFYSGALADMNYLDNGYAKNLYLRSAGDPKNKELFFSQNHVSAPQSPDTKIAQGSFIYGISVPRVLTTQTLGTFFGEQTDERYYDKEVREYYVQEGDTIASIANKFGISSDTLLWANNLSKNSVIKVGQKLVILPVSGVVHIIRSGDTVSQISKTYQAKSEDIVDFNELANEGDIFIGDILIIPGGVMPSRTYSALAQSPVASSFFIIPTEGKISQGLHWYNAVDIANKCGTPVYAAASGVVQRTSYGWNGGGGNLVTILHSEGVTSYYGHLMSILVSPGQQVNVGDRVALMGGGGGMVGAGISSGCHLHFGVSRAKNPLAKYYVGSYLSYK